MRLTGLGTSIEVSLVPLNKIESVQLRTEPQNTENGNRGTKKRYCFYCNKFSLFKAECGKMKRDKWQQTRTNNGPNSENACPKPKCDTSAKPKKLNIAGSEPMLPSAHSIQNARQKLPSKQLAQKKQNIDTERTKEGRHTQ